MYVYIYMYVYMYITKYTYTHMCICTDLNQIVQQLGVKELELQKKVYADSVKVHMYISEYIYINIHIYKCTYVYVPRCKFTYIKN
jgi:hypothetical protein